MSGYVVIHDYGEGDDFDSVEYEEKRIDDIHRIERSGTRPYLEEVSVYTEDGQKHVFPNARYIKSGMGKDE